MPLVKAVFVLDNSVTMPWCFEDEVTPWTDTILERLEQTMAIVPMLWLLEVANVLRSAERKGRVTQEKSNHFFLTLLALPINVDSETVNHAWGETMRLARLHKLTPYDASYLELALRLNLPLATLDKELRQAALASDVLLL
jgi:predicted nucleic acid-binding protein